MIQTKAPILTVTGLSAGYGLITVLNNVALTVREGTVTTLLGSNGAGKSTLMRALSGLIHAKSGTILLEGQDITAAASHDRVDAGLVLVPEGRLIFPTMNVEHNLRLGAISERARGEAMQRIEGVYQRFPRLRERRGQLAGTMSGGEQQMLAVGRGLMGNPKLLLLDEPTLGLAPIMVKRIFETIDELRRDGFTILLAEQNAHKATEIADYAYVLDHGHIALEGTGEALLGSEEVRQIYLGLNAAL